MNKVVVINEDGLDVREAPDTIDLGYLYSVCCKDTPDNKIVEVAGCRFTDETVEIWCHEEGRIVPLPVYFRLKSGEDFAGPVLITGSTEDGETVPLTDEQVEMVKSHVVLF